MVLRKPMTPTEIRLFKEAVIRQYKQKYEANKHKNKAINRIINRLRKILPVNIALGVGASIFYIMINGWQQFFLLIVTGIIWLTVISTILAAILGKK